MHEGGREFDQIYDLIAFRVLTSSVRDCYGALGVIHSLWKPVPGRFKDYIAMPKPNMYQSLHTTVIGPEGDPVEIQIRTHEMHRIAEEGIAAHWQYKEKKSDRDKFDAALRLAPPAASRSQKDLKDPREFLETVRVDLFHDEVYVFTPKGDVKALPEGSTPSTSRTPSTPTSATTASGAKVNGKLVPLRYKLRHGDIVEVVTSPDPASEPRLAQDRQVHPRALQDQPVAQGRGARPLARPRARAVRARGEEVPPVPRDADRVRGDEEARSPSSASRRRTICSRPWDTARRRCNRSWASSRPRWSTRRTAAPIRGRKRRPRSPRGRSGSAASTTSWSGSPSAVRRCPGTASWASSPAGRGLTVHARDCLTVVKNVLDKERFITVEWDGGAPTKRPVRIAVYIGQDRPGLLAEITGAISSRHGNITKAEVTVTEDRRGLNHFVVEVDDLRQLQEIMQAIREVSDVINVERIRT